MILSITVIHVFTSSDETEHVEENDEIQESIKELNDLFRKSVNYSVKSC